MIQEIECIKKEKKKDEYELQNEVKILKQIILSFFIFMKNETKTIIYYSIEFCYLIEYENEKIKCYVCIIQ